MIYPKNFEQKIGFDIIRQMLKDNCLSSLGEKFVEKIYFSYNFELIKNLISQVEEFRQILMFEDEFPTQDYYDLIPELNRIKIKGTIIDIEKLFDLKSSLNTIFHCLIFFKKTENEKYPHLKELSKDVIIEKQLLQRIDKIIDDKGKIKDNASQKLKEIRNELIRKQSFIDKKISQTLTAAKKAGWTSGDVEATVRNGRLVIPVLVANKRKIKGFIHDESATGQTVFIEPADIFDINNEIRELENAEKREIIKILTDFTIYLRPQIEDFKNAFRYLGLLDFIRAKAKFAISIEAVKPVIINEPLIDWKKTRHPLLYLSHKNQNKLIEPLDINLDKKNRILIISGPNAGGKSVCLKTVGLIQYMLQSGLLVPLKEDSELGIFEKIFIDIGDEQSLEKDLSTYTSHLLNLKYFVLNADKESLILIDEFGTGTEPQLGGAIAEAVLEKINEKKAFGVITTHYSNLKLFADKTGGIINGAMLFDSKNMQPLYELKIGKPGSSFAFEIARKIGFPKIILKNAAKKTGKKQLDFDKQLQQLEIEKREIDKKQTELKVADEFFSEIINKYESLVEKIKSTKESIISKAKEEAIEILNGSNKLIENTIREIREIQAEKEKTKELRKKLKEHKEKIIRKKSVEQLKPLLEKKKTKPVSEAVNASINVGDFVKIAGQDTIGEVIEISDEDVLITFNTVKFRTPINKLEKVSEKEKVKISQSSYSNIISDKIADFKLSIDVRGKRAEEAISIVRQYIDEAILLNMKEVNILHGKGDGILRDVIREYLSTVQEIKQYKDQHIERGGHGITVVMFR
ncbi:MAG: Smr/MutS family protein [Bacteroidales bacterium]|nr:Smr/MutS family protein [Bacteroidales bacterium]